MEEILRQFANEFGKFGISIPTENVQNKADGVIDQLGGWLIVFVFGNENGREFLEYYAKHRLTNDRHRKIYDSGETIDLDAIAAEQSDEENRIIASRLPLKFREELKKRRSRFY